MSGAFIAQLGLDTLLAGSLGFSLYQNWKWFRLTREAEEAALRAGILFQAARLRADGVNEEYVLRFLRNTEREAMELKLLRDPAQFGDGAG